MRLINCERWRRLRMRVLSSHPTCVMCEREGYVRAATEVHHVVPVETAFTLREKSALMYDPGNLMPLCHGCHYAIHFAMRKGTTRERQARLQKSVAETIAELYPDATDTEQGAGAGEPP